MPTLCCSVFSGLLAGLSMATVVLAGEPTHVVPVPNEGLAVPAKSSQAFSNVPDAPGDSLPAARSVAMAARPGPDQMLFILEYVTVRLPNGVAGFIPGQSVRLVGSDAKTGRLLVTDGRYRVEVAPRQVTGDPAMATFLRLRDEAEQRAFELARDASLIAQAKARRQFQAAKQQMELSQDFYLAGLVKPVVIGAEPLRFDPRWQPTNCMDVSYERHGDPYSAAHGHISNWKLPQSVDGLSHFVNGFGF